MSRRAQILQNSLAKKEARRDEMIERHFADVRSANGQPLNDKRCGPATMRRWERQNDAIRAQNAEIEKTQNALEREQYKIARVEVENETLPQAILDLVEGGVIHQWRKYPNRFFVPGVQKGRLIWNHKKNALQFSYFAQIPTTQQKQEFKRVALLVQQKIEEQKEK